MRAVGWADGGTMLVQFGDQTAYSTRHRNPTRARSGTWFEELNTLTSVATTRLHPHALEILLGTAAAEGFRAIALEMGSPARDAGQQARGLDARELGRRCGRRVCHDRIDADEIDDHCGAGREVALI